MENTNEEMTSEANKTDEIDETEEGGYPDGASDIHLFHNLDEERNAANARTPTLYYDLHVTAQPGDNRVTLSSHQGASGFFYFGFQGTDVVL